MDSLSQYDAIIHQCRSLFLKKNQDYGSAWRILRPSSLTDQIYIKAARIRNIEQTGVKKVEDRIEDEYVGMINYCIMALIQLQIPESSSLEMDTTDLMTRYDEHIGTTRELFKSKNHDYGEIWREMRITSYTDLILMKLLRIKQIEDNAGMVSVSEGIDANYMDIINYSVFALIRLEENISL